MRQSALSDQAFLSVIRKKLEGMKAHVIENEIKKLMNKKNNWFNFKKNYQNLCVSRETSEQKRNPTLVSDDVSLSLSYMRQSNPTNASENQKRRSVVSVLVQGVDIKIFLTTQDYNLRKIVSLSNDMNERVI